MSRTIYEVTLLELLPENLRSDPDIIAASQATDKEFQAVTKMIKNCLALADVDNAASEVLDNLAGEMNVDFYDRTFAIDKRRRLVKNGYLYKYKKGTTYAVKQIVSEAFENAAIREWFEYGGEPYRFRIVFSGSIPDTDKLKETIAAVKSIQNIRSHIEPTIASSDINQNMYFGGFVRQTNYQKIVEG